jgi:hypothetical protein
METAFRNVALELAVASPTKSSPLPAGQPASQRFPLDDIIDRKLGNLLAELADVHTPAPAKLRAAAAATPTPTPLRAGADADVPPRGPTDQLQVVELQQQVARLEASRDELARQQGEARAAIARMAGAAAAGEKRLRLQAEELAALKNRCSELEAEASARGDGATAEGTPEAYRTSRRELQAATSAAQASALAAQEQASKLKRILGTETMQRDEARASARARRRRHCCRRRGRPATASFADLRSAARASARCSRTPPNPCPTHTYTPKNL